MRTQPGNASHSLYLCALIISKSRVKAATKKCNVGGDFYGALDAAVRKIIAGAEERAQGNKRKTLKAVDL